MNVVDIMLLQSKQKVCEQINEIANRKKQFKTKTPKIVKLKLIYY